MSIIINRANLRRAIERCRMNHPRVQPSERPAIYFVTRTSGGTASVHFFVNGAGAKCAACDCPAGQRPTPLVCYHIAAALALHCARVRSNPEAAIGAASPFFCDDLPQPRPRSITQPQPSTSHAHAGDEAVYVKPESTERAEFVRAIRI